MKELVETQTKKLSFGHYTNCRTNSQVANDLSHHDTHVMSL